MSNPIEKQNPTEERLVMPRKEEKVELPTNQPVTLLTEKDAYISERIKSQPADISSFEVASRDEKLGIHRLSLHDYFEEQSYDCTRNETCPFHGWAKEEKQISIDGKKMTYWKQTKHGNFFFRWLMSNKRAIDTAMNIRGWYIVNRSHFQDAPKILFSANGGVENGDSILAFMPAKKGLALRNAPSQESLSKIKSEKERHKNNPNFYEAKLSPERQDGDDFAPSHALQEGRDF